MADGSDGPEEIEIENKCLRYIEGSLKILEQARAVVLNSTRPTATAGATTITTAPTTTASPPSVTLSSSSNSHCNSNNRTERAVTEFRNCFPGLSKSSSGRHLQTYFPTSAARSSPSSASYGSSNWSGKPANTWTHDFVCFDSTNSSLTPSSRELDFLRKAGLGRKKVIFKNKHGGAWPYQRNT